MSPPHKLNNTTHLLILLRSTILIDKLLTKSVLVGEWMRMCKIDKLLAILEQPNVSLLYFCVFSPEGSCQSPRSIVHLRCHFALVRHEHCVKFKISGEVYTPKFRGSLKAVLLKTLSWLEPPQQCSCIQASPDRLTVCMKFAVISVCFKMLSKMSPVDECGSRNYPCYL